MLAWSTMVLPDEIVTLAPPLSQSDQGRRLPAHPQGRAGYPIDSPGLVRNGVAFRQLWQLCLPSTHRSPIPAGLGSCVMRKTGICAAIAAKSSRGAWRSTAICGRAPGATARYRRRIAGRISTVTSSRSTASRLPRRSTARPWAARTLRTQFALSPSIATRYRSPFQSVTTTGNEKRLPLLRPTTSSTAARRGPIPTPKIMVDVRFRNRTKALGRRLPYALRRYASYHRIRHRSQAARSVRPSHVSGHRSARIADAGVPLPRLRFRSTSIGAGLWMSARNGTPWTEMYQSARGAHVGHPYPTPGRPLGSSDIWEYSHASPSLPSARRYVKPYSVGTTAHSDPGGNRLCLSITFWPSSRWPTLTLPTLGTSVYLAVPPTTCRWKGAWSNGD